MNNRTGGYIPKSRIEKITTTLGKTIGRDKLRDGNAISDKPIQGRRVSSDNDNYLTKSEIRSIKTTDGRLIKRDFIKDGNFLKNASVKHPKVARTQFEEEEYEYADGGAVDSEMQKKIDGIEKFINNPENQKNDPATVEKFRNILASIKPKASAPATPKATAPATPKAKAGRPKGTSTTSKEKIEDVAERLSEVYYNTLEDLKIESGSEVYANIDVQKKLKKVLDEKIKEKSLSEAVFKYLENENAHTLNNYLSLSGLFGKEQQKDYVRLFKVYKGKNFWNPSVFGIDVNKFTFEKATATATPKATMTKKAEPQAKTSKGVKVTGSSSVTVDGKEMDMNSKEFCDYLLKQFRDRREKSKNAPKKKTASVMAKITANVEKSVVQAIKSSVASNKKEIEKNPNFFVKKVEKLETSTKSFLQSMKDVLGDDFKEGEIASTMKSIEELTESLIAKYKTK